MLLRKLRQLPRVKKVFIRSGIRFDYLMADPRRRVLHRAGAAPHLRPAEGGAGALLRRSTLDYMGKPHIEVYDQFRKKYLTAQPALRARTSIWSPTSSPPIRAAPWRMRSSWRSGSTGHGLHAGAGAGLLSHARHPVHLHVLHRPGPPHHAAGLRPHARPTTRPSSGR